MSIHFVKYHVLAVVDDKNFNAPSGYSWKSLGEALSDYQAFKNRLSPPTLGIIHGLLSDTGTSTTTSHVGSGSQMYRYWRALAQENEDSNWGTFTHLEFAPFVECIPIQSNTLAPFHATNLVTVLDGDHILIVDPGANTAGHAHFSSVLSRFSASKMHVFLTHHHHDHIEALDLVGRHFPGCNVIGHPYTINKVKERFGEDSHLNFVTICDDDKDEKIEFGETRELVALALAGHTRGHLAIWDKKSKTLLSGDHTVGFGSSVLDPDGGGNMKAYLDSTHRLLEFPVEVILPCHGAPTLINPLSLLNSYIKHRLEREKDILEAWNSGITEMEGILEKVYKDTPPKLYGAATRNIILHLEKLSDEKKIKLTPKFEELIHSHQNDDDQHFQKIKGYYDSEKQ